MGTILLNQEITSSSIHVEDNLRFIQEVIDGLRYISNERRTFLEEQLNMIKARSSNPNLNLALIGKFSSGKSTFINSWLNRTLLKTAMRATTSVPTRIYYLKGSTEPMLEAMDYEGNHYSLNSPRRRNQFTKKYDLPETKDITEFLYAVTTEDKLADKMKYISVGIDSEQLEAGICIIDTPGTDAGEERAYAHRLQTQNALREHADAAIILFPAERVLTADFEQFLGENASHFLADAIFVISMCDRIEASELEELLQFVKKRLKDVFNLNQPIIYSVAAKYVMTDSTDEKAKEWKASFQRMQHEVGEILHSQRARILNKQINRLFGELLIELEKDLKQNRQLLEDEIKALEQNSPASLKNKLAKLYESHYYKFQENMIKVKATANRRLNLEVLEVKAQLCRRIDACNQVYGDSFYSIAYVKKNDVKAAANDISRNIKSKVQEDLKPLINIINEHQEECSNLFEQYQYQLQGQQYEGETITTNVEMTLGKVDVYGEYDNKKSGLESAIELGGILIAIPLMIPLVILDDIFDWEVADAVEKGIGKLGNWWNKVWDNLSSAKDKNKAAIRSAFDKAEREGRAAFEKSVEDTIISLNTQLDQVRHKYIKAYKPIFDQKEKEFEREKNRLDKLIKKDDVTAEEIKKRLSSLT